jgi:hypothetical protein
MTMVLKLMFPFKASFLSCKLMLHFSHTKEKNRHIGLNNVKVYVFPVAARFMEQSLVP